MNMTLNTFDNTPGNTFSRTQRLGAWALLCMALCAAMWAAMWTGSAHAAAATRVQIKTSAGTIEAQLYPEHAPRTVANFLQYAKDKHYEGTVFHRVIAQFMIQGGGFDARLRQKPTRAAVPHEGHAALQAGLKNTTGTLAMARTQDPQSATSQFFINTVDNPFLDPTPIPSEDPVKRFEFQGRVYENVSRNDLLKSPQLYGYTVFGRVTAGMDVVQRIRDTPTGASGSFASDVPQTPITILSITLIP